MNMYATENDPYDFESSRLSPSGPGPNSKMGDGYSRRDMAPSFDKEPPRLKPLNTMRPQSSMVVDLNDPIQVHLLTETALTDSKSYEILSQEEVDDLKKQVQSLSQRVESTRTNLMIQSKYRDAAVSMAKLYGPRRGGDEGDGSREGDADIQASQQKCDALSAELYNLEKRLMFPHRRLLEHTAGILQLTHKASKRRKNQAGMPGQLINGMPGSPESLHTYTRNSMDAAGEGNYFADGTIDRFQQMDSMQLQTRDLPRTNPLEIPMKSPIRGQANQLREEMDRVRDENLQLRSQMGDLVNSISHMEGRLGNLNGSLKEAIVRFDPTKNSDFDDPPNNPENSASAGEQLKSQMDYLETGLFAIQAEQESMGAGKEMSQKIESLNRQIRNILLTVNPEYPPVDAPADDSEGQLTYLERSLQAMDAELARAVSSGGSGSALPQDPEQVEVVLKGLWDLIQTGYANIKQQREDRRKARKEKGLAVEEEDMSEEEEFSTDEPYTLMGFSTRVRWLYSQATTLKDQKFVLKRQIKQQRILNNKSDAEKDEELQRKQEEIEQNQIYLDRAEKDAMDAQAMLSDALQQLEEAREAATMARSTRPEQEVDSGKVKKLEAEVSQLENDLTAAKLEVKQLRENLAATGTHTQQLQSRLSEAEAKIQERQSSLDEAESKGHQLELRLDMAKTEVSQLQANLEAAESGSKSRQGRLTDVEVTIATLKKDLEEANKSRAQADESTAGLKSQIEAQKDALTEREKALKAKEDELEDLNMNMVEMKTELTIAQAELDGAYGTRAERAAAVAAVKQSAEVLKKQNEVDRLKKELAATVRELEEITKEKIGAEREKLDLEAKLDEALGNRAELENEITSLRDRLHGELEQSREKMAKLEEELDSERLKGGSGSGQRPGASMLSEQFRATMREERKKFQEGLKEERTRTRKLEEELSRLRRAVGPGKGPLSPGKPPPSA